MFMAAGTFGSRCLRVRTSDLRELDHSDPEKVLAADFASRSHTIKFIWFVHGSGALVTDPWIGDHCSGVDSVDPSVNLLVVC